jgi:RNA polymerase sigma-70 factor, ECF subfamily
MIRQREICVNRVMMAYAQSVSDSWPPFCPSWLRGQRVAVRHRPKLVRMTAAKPSHANENNALIVSIARDRDRRAFEALFAYFAPRVKGYLLRLGASGALAEDLAQEAMLTIWRKAALFDPSRASASTWIFTIARNLRIDAIRRERHPDFDPNDPALVPDEEVSADDKMVLEDDGERLHAVLKELPLEQAQVVQMSFFADKPHSEIAQELGLPLGTVKSRLRLAMARIRGAMGEKE